ncbi:hypothetical protein IEQ34_012815 [Dendrobium chrysotoxum]|uniref:DUF4283 domain-containing protein n=1 Tax=Dendrobium chrysotoxum TaxID=161865 RepID=A0AAV7G6J1_DENCH|nr:hypothetical protein IEQ34_012815 [Dendrobium chrysotoxum]
MSLLTSPEKVPRINLYGGYVNSCRIYGCDSLGCNVRYIHRTRKRALPVLPDASSRIVSLRSSAFVSRDRCSCASLQPSRVRVACLLPLRACASLWSSAFALLLPLQLRRRCRCFTLGYESEREVATGNGRVFAHRSYFVSICFMKLTKWSPFVDIAEESPIIPVWISFPNLRPHFFCTLYPSWSWLHFWSSPSYGCCTEVGFRPSFARVLVELDIKKRHPDSHFKKERARLHPHLVKDPTLPRENVNNNGSLLDSHLLNPIVNVRDMLSNDAHDNVQGNVGVDLSLNDNVDVGAVSQLENEIMLHPLNVVDVGHSFDFVNLGSEGPVALHILGSVSDKDHSVSIALIDAPVLLWYSVCFSYIGSTLFSSTGWCGTC